MRKKGKGNTKHSPNTNYHSDRTEENTQNEYHTELYGSELTPNLIFRGLLPSSEVVNTIKKCSLNSWVHYVDKLTKGDRP